MNNFIHINLEPKEEIFSWKSLLSFFSLEKINQEIEKYEISCLHYQTSYTIVEKSINSLFNIEILGHEFAPNFQTNITVLYKRKDFPLYCFRIRKITKRCRSEIIGHELNFEDLEFEEMQTLQDAWERPACLINDYQRLNKPGKSVLYTSLMPSTAVLETNLNKKDIFFLIIYKNKKTFQMNDCCKFIYIDELTEDENMKRYLIFSFLRNEFTRILPGAYNEGFQYCISYSISKKFFISEDTSCIQYPSIRGLGHKNAAFWGDIRDNLELVGLRLCFLNEKKGIQSHLSILVDCFWDEVAQKFIYYSPFSEESKRIFGDPYLSVMMMK